MLNFDLVLLFSGLFLIALAIYLFTQALIAGNADVDALAWASGDEPTKSKNGFINFSRPLVHNFALSHAQRIKSENYRRNVEKKLLTAGLHNELNVDEFIGLQVFWGILFPIFFAVLNFALALGFSWPIIAIAGVIGAYFPHLYCNQEKKARYLSVVSDMPFFIDLLALSTQAGDDFTGALSKIVQKAEGSVLADEIGIVLKDIKLGSSRSDALKALSSRLDNPEVTSFVAVVVDADQTGASVAGVLKDQSEQMRMERFMRAEKAGAAASQAILMPMIFFILPAVFIMVFGPVILNFVYGGG